MKDLRYDIPYLCPRQASTLLPITWHEIYYLTEALVPICNVHAKKCIFKKRTQQRTNRSGKLYCPETRVHPLDDSIDSIKTCAMQ